MNRAQHTACMRGLPPYAAPTVTQAPYIASESRVGDTVYSVPSTTSPGYPGPLTIASQLAIAGVTQPLSYVLQASDAGKSLTRIDIATNGLSSAAPSVSVPVLIGALQAFGDLGYVGGNVDNSYSYNTVRWFTNAALDVGRSYSVIGNFGYAYSVASSFPAGSLGLSGTSGSVTVTLTGSGTQALAGDTTDVGRVITVGGTTATITASASASSCTATLAGTASGTSFTSGSWSITGPSLVFSATSGSGVTMRLPTTAAPLALVGNAQDVGKSFALGSGISALVTGFTDTQHCTVTIVGGTLASTTVTADLWSVAAGLDSNGFPMSACQNVYSETYVNAGQYGEANFAPGVYHWTFKSATNAFSVDLSGLVGATHTTPVMAGPGSDGQYTTTFDVTVQSGVNVTLQMTFSTGFTFVDAPRGGLATSAGQPLFNQEAIAHYAQFPMLRFMDFFQTNSRTDANWNERPIDYPIARNRFSYELHADLVNAIAAYPGSKLAGVILNTPPKATIAYTTNLSALYAARLTSSVILYPERSNEEWNTQTGFHSYFYDRAIAYPEVQAISTPVYGGGTPQIASVVGNGTTATVTLAAALPAYITAGAPFAMYSQGNAAWRGGTVAAPLTVASINAGTNSFTFASTTFNTMVVGSEKFCCVFNLSSASQSLTADGNFDLYSFTFKYHARQSLALWNGWKVARPNDRFLISAQIGNTATVVGASAFFNGGDATWAYGMVVAPYTTPSGATTVDQVFAQMDAYRPTLKAVMQQHVYTCKAYGLHPMAYEGGPQFFDGSGVSGHDVQYAANRDPRMQTGLQNLWLDWLEVGGEHLCHYFVSPQWWCFFSALNNYSDTASPKFQALLAAAATPKNYPESTAADSTNYQYQSINGTVNATNGVRYAFTTSPSRYYRHMVSFNRGRRYKFAIEGTTDTIGTQVTLALDGVVFGTPMTIARNGTPQSGAAASVNTDTFIAEMPSGFHLLDVQFGSTAPTSSGYKRVTITPV